MFVDASAFVAILTLEDDWMVLTSKLEASSSTITSALALWETSAAITRANAIPFAVADERIGLFMAAHSIQTVPITPEIGALAIEASRRFGRGRHPAGLNLGDCFAYACARAHRVPLLFKGEDFPLTDIEPA